MFRQFRTIEKGEFIIVGGDTSQGGLDENFVQFFSKSKLDFPMVYQKHGVAAEVTSALFPVLERIYDVTGFAPLVCLERNNGGASEMQRLAVLNRLNKYKLFKMVQFGLNKTDAERETDKLGWDTNVATRPIMLGDWKAAFDARLVTIYDEETLNQHKSFILNKQGKPEAARGKHDDAVMSCAIAWQLNQMTPMPTLNYEQEEPEWAQEAPAWSQS